MATAELIRSDLEYFEKCSFVTQEDIKQEAENNSSDDFDRAAALHNLPPLGEKLPSELMECMIALLPPDKASVANCFLFRFLFLCRLPEELCTYLISAKYESSLDLAAAADSCLESKKTALQALSDEEFINENLPDAYRDINLNDERNRIDVTEEFKELKTEDEDNPVFIDDPEEKDYFDIKPGKRGAKTKSTKRNERVYTCNACKYTTKNLNLLAKHQQSKHKLEKYSCGECEFTTSAFKDLKSHIKTLHKVKLKESKIYSCDLCEFTATVPRSLRRHKVKDIFYAYL